MSNRQLLLALHSLYPRPWPQLRPLYTALLSPTTNHPKFPDHFSRDWKRVEHFDFDRYYNHHQIHPLTIFDSDYPSDWKELHDPPAVVYAKGNLLHLRYPYIAIVGAREATAYSASCIQQILPVICARGFGICSGMAKGADGMAHQAALTVPVPTIAVLGSGFQFIYPKQHERLFQTLCETELVLTEYPPNAAPMPHQFIARNRLISGLAKAVVITEAAEKSGTMSTADFAVDLGKDVATFPGRIDAPLSVGPHLLIQQGAQLIQNTADFSEFLDRI